MIGSPNESFGLLFCMVKISVTIYHFTPNQVGECVYIAVGHAARGKAVFANLTHPQTPALAGASVRIRKVIRFWITVGINVYIITKIYSVRKADKPNNLSIFVL